MLTSSCVLNNVQYQSNYSGKARGVITDVYRNNLGGTTVVLDGKYNINVWDKDLDSTMQVGKVKDFKVRWLTYKLKRL